MADACLYPPLGHRSASSTVPHLRFRDWPVAAARARLNEQAMLICQIETLLGVENASAIAAVDGVSMLLLGGNDLSADMGIPGEYTHPRFIEAVGRNPAAKEDIGANVYIGFAVTEAIALFALIIGLISLFG